MRNPGIPPDFATVRSLHPGYDLMEMQTAGACRADREFPKSRTAGRCQGFRCAPLGAACAPLIERAWNYFREPTRLWMRPLAAAAPGCDPILDPLVGDRFAAIEGRDRPLDAGNLPLVDVEVLVDRLGREEGTAAARALGQFLQPLLGGGVDPHREGRRAHDLDPLCSAGIQDSAEANRCNGTTGHGRALEGAAALPPASSIFWNSVPCSINDRHRLGYGRK